MATKNKLKIYEQYPRPLGTKMSASHRTMHSLENPSYFSLTDRGMVFQSELIPLQSWSIELTEFAPLLGMLKALKIKRNS